jgi:hypothetical protein
MAAPGRTKQHAADRLSAGGLSSLGGANSLFSRSSLLSNSIYNTQALRLQEGIPFVLSKKRAAV